MIVDLEKARRPCVIVYRFIYRIFVCLFGVFVYHWMKCELLNPYGFLCVLNCSLTSVV
jgi:hypothetical protein